MRFGPSSWIGGAALTLIPLTAAAQSSDGALQPVVAQLSHAAGFARDDTPAAKRAKIEKVLAQGSDNVGAAIVRRFPVQMRG